MGAVTVTIDLPPGLPALLNSMTQAQQGAVVYHAARNVAPVLTAHLRQRALAVTGPGPTGFSNGWLATPSDTGVGVTNTIGLLARWIELPTRPHVIEARPGTHTVSFPAQKRVSKKGKSYTIPAHTAEMPNVLAWMPGRRAFSAYKVNASTKNAQSWVYATKVNHPGTRGQEIFRLVMDFQGSDDVIEALSTAAMQLLSGDPS